MKYILTITDEKILFFLAAGLVLLMLCVLQKRASGKKRFLHVVLDLFIATGILFAAFVYIREEKEMLSLEEKIEERVDLDALLPFENTPFVEIHDNVPYFTKEDLEKEPFMEYGELDLYGRCTEAYALITPDTLPEEERGDISEVRPSGWQNSVYDFIDGGFLYNRCHLIAYELTGQNANEKNLITGTRYMNVYGMEPFENKTAWYIRTSGNSVLYRVTPVYRGKDLVASGVLMEAYSIEDYGAGICFCVYCYNEQPGIVIDHTTGKNHLK